MHARPSNDYCPSCGARVACRSSITLFVSVPISSRTRIIGKIADVAARPISVGVEALRLHLRRIAERARASIIDASRLQAWIMITIQPAIIAIPDRPEFAPISAAKPLDDTQLWRPAIVNKYLAVDRTSLSARRGHPRGIRARCPLPPLASPGDRRPPRGARRPPQRSRPRPVPASSRAAWRRRRSGHNEPVGVGSAVLSRHQVWIEHEDYKCKSAVVISCIYPRLYRTRRQNVSTWSYRLAHGRQGNCLLCRA